MSTVTRQDRDVHVVNIGPYLPDRPQPWDRYNDDSSDGLCMVSTAYDEEREKLAKEKELKEIVEDLTLLNEMSHELSTMTYQQGTLADRIDYNINQTETSVEEGTSQLEVAQDYKYRKRKCCLATLLIFIILIITTIVVLIVKLR